MITKQFSDNISQDTLENEDYDFLLCSTVSWIQTLEESKSSFKTCQSAAMCQFSQNVCKLALQVSELMEKIECQHGSNHKLVEELHEFFSASIYPIPLGLFVDLGPEAANGAVQESFLCALGK